MGDSDSRKIQELLSNDPKCRELAEIISAYAIDLTIHNVLGLFEEEESIQLVVEDESGATNLSKISDGLCGELYGEGWIKTFSEYPHSLLGS
jgi:hypothetical protein